MNLLLKGSAFALAIAGTTLTGGCMMDREGHHRGDDGGSVTVGMDFGAVRYGYSDGYWDNGHQWHRWNDDADMQTYRARRSAAYRDWHHDRDGSDGWDHD